MKLLHVFLNRVVNHPILSCDKNLHIFLTTKPAVSTSFYSIIQYAFRCYIFLLFFFSTFKEFLIHRKNRSNVLVKVTDSLQNIASTYTIKQRHYEFEQIRDYCTALGEKLATIDKINHRIHKERQGTVKNKFLCYCYNYIKYFVNSITYCRLLTGTSSIASDIHLMGHFWARTCSHFIGNC